MSTAVTYHQATKYHPETIGQGGAMDWTNQPVPYKEYDCADPVLLADFLPLILIRSLADQLTAMLLFTSTACFL